MERCCSRGSLRSHRCRAPVSVAVTTTDDMPGPKHVQLDTPSPHSSWTGRQAGGTYVSTNGSNDETDALQRAVCSSDERACGVLKVGRSWV